MPRRPNVWYRKFNKTYYTTINGQQIPLSKNKREAHAKFYQLMAAPKSKPIKSDSIAAVLDDFLDWAYTNLANSTAERYEYFYQPFVKDYGRTRVTDLHAGHVTDWLAQKSWNSTTQHNAITALQRAFNWATKNRGLKFNPIAGMEKPKAKTRTIIISPEDFDELMSHVPDQPFRDLMFLSYDVGCRPFEIKDLEARHVELSRQRAVIPADEAKKGIQRAFYFATDRSMQIITRLVKEHPTGVLLRNNRGNKWTRFAVSCRFKRIEQKTGKHYFHYAMRHTQITRSLAAGVDSHVVARLAGHQNTAMLDRVYSHVADDYDFMLREAKKAAADVVEE